MQRVIGTVRPRSYWYMQLRTRFLSLLAVVFGSQLAFLFGQVVSSGQSAQASGGTQEVSSASPSSSDVSQMQAVTAYQQGQDSLASEYKALVVSGASPEQIRQWVVTNTPRIQAQAQQAQTMSLAAATGTLTLSGATRLPSGPLSAGATFVNSQASLNQAFITARKLIIARAQTSGSALTEAEADRLAVRALAQQNASVLNAQRQRAAAFAATAVEQTPASPISPLIPPGASPQMVEYLNARQQLRQGIEQFENQYASSSPVVQSAAWQRWKTQNSALIQRLNVAAQNLAQASLQN